MEKRNIYKGQRYVPKIMGEWNQEETYEGLSIVTNKGASYTSKKRVPVGIDISDEEYWVVTGNYDAQVENYRQELKDYEQETDHYKQETTTFTENLADQLTHTNKKIDNIVIDLSDYLVADGVTDDYDNLMNAFNVKGHRDFIFPENKTILISRQVDLKGTQVRNVDLNDSTLLMPNGGFKSEIYYYQSQTFRNGRITGSGVGRAFSIGEGRVWGTKVDIDKIKIRDFEIGIFTTGTYFSNFTDIDIRGCQVGIYLGTDVTMDDINNVLYFNQCTLLQNKYNMFITSTLNTRFNNMVFQQAEYAIVFSGRGGDRNRWLEFNNPWFEAIEKANVTFGSIDLNTYQLTKSKHEKNLHLFDFNNSYYFGEQPFIDKAFPFTNQFYDDDGFYTKNRNLLGNHLTQPDNVLTKELPETSFITDNETVSARFKKTTFGNLWVTTISGNPINHNARIVLRSRGDYKKGDKLLFKFLIKATMEDEVHGHTTRHRHFVLSEDASEPAHIQIRKGVWNEGEALVELNTDSNLVTHTIYVNNVNGEMSYDDEMTVEIANAMVVNLSDTIGSEFEFTQGMTHQIASLIPYKPQMMFEQGRFVGETYFDKDTSKTYTWNGTDWVDAMGVIHEPDA